MQIYISDAVLQSYSLPYSPHLSSASRVELSAQPPLLPLMYSGEVHFQLAQQPTGPHGSPQSKHYHCGFIPVTLPHPEDLWPLVPYTQ